jgi:hypothetical protein
MTSAKAGFHQPESLTAKTPRMVSDNGIPEFAGKSKTYPVILHIVFQHKKLCAPAAKLFTFAKNLLNLFPSL